LAGVAYGGGIYTSADSGGTWTPATVPTTNWMSVASSADGTKLAAVVDGGGIRTAIMPCWISQQPESVLACPGSSHTLQITSGGTPPLSYRWRKNQTTLFDSGNITGSATTNLTLRNLSPSDTANYDVVVTNGYGRLTSSVATLTVTLKPAIAAPIVLNGFITGATLLDGGCGYSSAPAISFSGQGGSGAIGYAQISNGTVTNIVVTSAGHGYPTNAMLLIAPPVYPSLRIAQSLLSPPTATAIPIIASGFVVAAIVTGGGSGYTEPPSVSFSDVNGSGAAAYAQVSNGSVANIVVTNAGSNYSRNVVIIISPPLSFGIVTLSATNLMASQTYQLTVASNLHSWTNYGPAFVATNTFWTPTDHWNLVFANGVFFRLRMFQ
jgi:hypothetical protein